MKKALLIFLLYSFTVSVSAYDKEYFNRILSETGSMGLSTLLHRYPGNEHEIRNEYARLQWEEIKRELDCPDSERLAALLKELSDGMERKDASELDRELALWQEAGSRELERVYGEWEENASVRYDELTSVMDSEIRLFTDISFEDYRKSIRREMEIMLEARQREFLNSRIAEKDSAGGEREDKTGYSLVSELLENVPEIYTEPVTEALEGWYESGLRLAEARAHWEKGVAEGFAEAEKKWDQALLVYETEKEAWLGEIEAALREGEKIFAERLSDFEELSALRFTEISTMLEKQARTVSQKIEGYLSGYESVNVMLREAEYNALLAETEILRLEAAKASPAASLADYRALLADTRNKGREAEQRRESLIHEMNNYDNDATHFQFTKENFPGRIKEAEEERDSYLALIPALQKQVAEFESLVSETDREIEEYRSQESFWKKAVKRYVETEEKLRTGLASLEAEIKDSSGLEADSGEMILEDMNRRLRMYRELYDFAEESGSGGKTAFDTRENLEKAGKLLAEAELAYGAAVENMGGSGERTEQLLSEIQLLSEELEKTGRELAEVQSEYNLYYELFMNDGAGMLKTALEEEEQLLADYRGSRQEAWIDYFMKCQAAERGMMLPFNELTEAVTVSVQSCLQLLEEDISEEERLLLEDELESLLAAEKLFAGMETVPEPGTVESVYLRRCLEWEQWNRDRGAALIAGLFGFDGTETQEEAESFLMELSESGFLPDYLLYCAAGYLKQFHDFSGNDELALLYEGAVGYDSGLFGKALSIYMSGNPAPASADDAEVARTAALGTENMIFITEAGLNEKRRLLEALERDRHTFFRLYVEPYSVKLRILQEKEVAQGEAYNRALDEIDSLLVGYDERKKEAREKYSLWKEALYSAELAEKIHLYAASPYSSPEDILAEIEKQEALIADYSQFSAVRDHISSSDMVSAENFYRAVDTELYLNSVAGRAEEKERSRQNRISSSLRNVEDIVIGQLFRFDAAPDVSGIYSSTGEITDMRGGLPDSYFDDGKRYYEDVLAWLGNVDAGMLHDFGIAYYWRTGCSIDVPIYRDQNFHKLRSYGYAFSYPVEYTDNTASRAVYDRLVSDSRTHILYSFFEEMMKNDRILFDTSFIGKDVSKIAHDYLWNVSKEKESHYRNSHRILNALTRKASKMKSMRKGMADINGTKERNRIMEQIGSVLKSLEFCRSESAEAEKQYEAELFSDAGSFLSFCEELSGVKIKDGSLAESYFAESEGEKSFVAVVAGLRELCKETKAENSVSLSPETALSFVNGLECYGHGGNIASVMELTGSLLISLHGQKGEEYLDSEADKAEWAALLLSEDCRYWTENMLKLRQMGLEDWDANYHRLVRERTVWEEKLASEIAEKEKIWDLKGELLEEKMREWLTEAALLEAEKENAETARELGLNAFALRTSADELIVPMIDFSPEIVTEGDSLDRLLSLALEYNRAAVNRGEITEIYPLLPAVFRTTEIDMADTGDFFEEVKRQSTYLAVLQMKGEISEMYRQIILNVEENNMEADKAITDVLEGRGYRLDGNVFSRKIMIDETILGGIEYEVQEIERYRWFSAESFDIEKELSSFFLHDESAMMLRHILGKVRNELDSYAAETMEAFSMHIGYVPVMSEKDPEKVSVKGAGEYGRIFELFYVNEGRLARGLAAIDVPFYLQRLYDDDRDNDGKSDGLVGAPTIRGATRLLTTLLGSVNPVLGIAASVLDSITYAALDMGFAGKDLAEAAADVGYSIGNTAAAMGIGAALGSVTAIAENALLGTVSDLYVTNVAAAAICSADVEDFIGNYMEQASLVRNYNSYISAGIGSLTGGIGALGYELLSDGETRINIMNIMELNVGGRGPLLEFGSGGQQLAGMVDYVGSFFEKPDIDLYSTYYEMVKLMEDESYAAMYLDRPESDFEEVLEDSVMEYLEEQLPEKISDITGNPEICYTEIYDSVINDADDYDPAVYDFPVEGDIGRGYSFLEGTIGEYRAVEKEFSAAVKEEFASKPAAEQMKDLMECYTRVRSGNYSDTDRGNMAAALRDLVKYMDVEALMEENEDFMNITLRNFLNLKEDGTMDYTLDEIRNETGMWTEMMSWGSAYHQTNVEGELLNAKFVSRDGREVVFDSDENVVLDILDKGTFNYGRQTLAGTLFGLHRSADVEPYNRHMKNIGAKVKHRFDLLLGMLGNSRIWELRGKR